MVSWLAFRYGQHRRSGSCDRQCRGLGLARCRIDRCSGERPISRSDRSVRIRGQVDPLRGDGAARWRSPRRPNPGGRRFSAVHGRGDGRAVVDSAAFILGYRKRSNALSRRGILSTCWKGRWRCRGGLRDVSDAIRGQLRIANLGSRHGVLCGARWRNRGGRPMGGCVQPAVNRFFCKDAVHSALATAGALVASRCVLRGHQGVLRSLQRRFGVAFAGMCRGCLSGDRGGLGTWARKRHLMTGCILFCDKGIPPRVGLIAGGMFGWGKGRETCRNRRFPDSRHGPLA